MNPLVNRPLPIAFGGPGAVTVAGTRQRTPAGTGGGSPPAPARSPPVQLLRHVIRAQQRERHPALRAAVPVPREIPDHLEPGQMRVIPPPRPRPRAALLPRSRSRALRAGRHHRHPPPAGGSGRDFSDDRPNTIRCSTARPARSSSSSAASAAFSAAQPRDLLPQPRVSPPAASSSAASAAAGSPPAPQPAHPAATPQHPPHPGQRQPQPPRSTANILSSRKSRTHASVSRPQPPLTPATSRDFRILTYDPLRLEDPRRQPARSHQRDR